MAWPTVVIFSASSSGISVSNSSSSAMTSSTVSSESAPRSSTNDDSFLISASFTPSCSATIFLTRCSTFSMHLLPVRGVKKGLQATKPADFTRAPVALRHQHPAIDVQRRAGDVTRSRGREEHDGGGDVVRLTEAAKRDAREQRFALRAGHRARHVGVDEAGCDAVDGDVATAHFERERLREADE